jgi:hypothetical protein
MNGRVDAIVAWVSGFSIESSQLNSGELRLVTVRSAHRLFDGSRSLADFLDQFTESTGRQKFADRQNPHNPRHWKPSCSVPAIDGGTP